MYDCIRLYEIVGQCIRLYKIMCHSLCCIMKHCQLYIMYLIGLCLCSITFMCTALLIGFFSTRNYDHINVWNNFHKLCFNNLYNINAIEGVSIISGLENKIALSPLSPRSYFKKYFPAPILSKLKVNKTKGNY